MPRRPGLKWGDTRIAFRIIETRVLLAIRSGRTVKAVYGEVKAFFPGSYSQFARYVQQSSARPIVRETADQVGSPHVGGSSADRDRKNQGPLDIVLVPPPARFKHNPDPDSWEGLI